MQIAHQVLSDRVLKAESDLDIVDENYRTLSDEIEGLKDRAKYNHNDILDLMQRLQSFEKKLDKVQPKRSLLSKIFKV